MTKNNSPIVEQLIIENTKSTQTQLQVSDILKTKQLIPHNFIQLETKGKNYMCSTEGWKEPVCERYGFTYEGKWVQLDVPHTLVEKLELKKGESISYPIYISSKLLNKEPEFGGITLSKEDEMFLLKPLTKDEEVQTEMSGERIDELERKIEEQARRIRELEITVAERKTKRNWKGFYEWLKENHAKIINNKDLYPNFTQNNNFMWFLLDGSLEFYVNKKTSGKYSWGWQDKFLPLEYDHNKSFYELFRGDGNNFYPGYILRRDLAEENYTGSKKKVLDEYEFLLAEWRKTT